MPQGAPISPSQGLAADLVLPVVLRGRAGARLAGGGRPALPQPSESH